MVQPRVAVAWGAEAEAIPLASRALLGVGLNPLVQAASPLLLLTAQVRETLSSTDVAGLRRHTLEEIRRFEEHARSSGVPEKVVLSARYALCAGLDEAVLSTPWGDQSEWKQNPLLVQLHGKTVGGEKFFEVLEGISQDPARYIDLMELQYLELAFGFTGKYGQLAGRAREGADQGQERGHERLQDVQQDLYRKIRHYRGPTEPGLSLRWRGLEDRRNPLVRYIPWWVVGAAALLILTITFTAYYASLARAAAPVQAALAKVGLEDYSVPPAAAPVKALTLKQLLAADEKDRKLSAVEQGTRTTVTLLARDLFLSGSATVNPAYLDTLRRLANALNRVPGRVLVVGHTDDQPIKSLQYDNYALSRARAVSVITILGQGMPRGAGSSEPRYTPESDPENRARNRRVEIIHVRGT
jgi:type VI secretion system protein ImpK